MRHVAIVLLILLCLAVVGCQNTPNGDLPRPVKSMVVALEYGQKPTLLTGQIAAHKYVNAAFRISGKIAERYVSVGDAVTVGTVLARLDDTVVKDSLTSAKADVATAQATLEQDRKQALRVANLFSAHAVSKRENEATTRQFKATTAQLEAAKSRQHTAEEQLMYTMLTSESDGLVVNKFAESGEVVNAGQPVFKIAENNAYDAVFDMPESLLVSLRPGRAMEVCLDRLNNVCSEATIYEISPEADFSTRTYQTKAIIAQPGQMPMGATVVGRILLPEEKIIRIPSAAVLLHDGRPSGWVIDASSSRVTARPIEVGQYTTDAVIVANGLEAGEKIVTAGGQALRQGQKIRETASDEAH